MSYHLFPIPNEIVNEGSKTLLYLLNLLSFKISYRKTCMGTRTHAWESTRPPSHRCGPEDSVLLLGAFIETIKMKTREVLSLLTILCFCAFRAANGWIEPVDPRPDKSLYSIGVGIYDVTGPAAGVNLMGYANPSQINKGIHMRLFSRAYIISDGTRRVVFVSVDCGMMSSILKIKLIPILTQLYGNLYTDENVILSGTHTHSGPAGFLQYLIFDITSLGFIEQTFQAMLDGMFQSIVNAHNNMQDGYIYVSSGDLLDASANRSPAGYANNPDSEKAQYQYDTDKLMTLLKFVDIDGNDLGMVNWFATHGTSMNNTNALISGDNKGYASQLFEQSINIGSMPGKGPFVAAFAQTNCGDVSPNTQGAHCQDTGLPCDILTSTCNNRSHLCIAAGPGKDMMESTKIIGERQFQKAWDLYHNSSAVKLTGPVQFMQQYIDMGNFTFTSSNGTVGTTCEPALGYSFAAGTTDGPGAFDFTQGMTDDNPFWNSIVGAIVPPRPEQIACQAPKPVLLDTGNYNYPYPWHPRIMDTQIGRIGDFFILAVPGEFTTMAGRRIRDKIIQSALNNGLPNATPVIAGLSNIYSHYITTFEEYQIQRYEAASTLFGPDTLEAYMYQYSYLLDSLATGASIAKGPLPLDLYDVQITLLPPNLYDTAETGKSFGEVIAQPYPLVYKGETQVAVFVAGHPRNNVRLGGTFLRIERQINATYWELIATDSHWQTRFMYDTTSKILGTGEITIYWDIPTDTPNGIYRIKHFGSWKSFSLGQIEEYQGVTWEFIVEDPPLESRENYRDPVYIDPFGWMKHFFG